MTSHRENCETLSPHRALPTLLDVGVGAGLFLLLLAASGHLADLVSPGRAAAMGLEAAGTGAGDALAPAFRSARHATSMVDPATLTVLGLTFSVLFAFNAALLRHLRRAYASPRRDGWGRGR
jgi:hypothetical protein